MSELQADLSGVSATPRSRFSRHLSGDFERHLAPGQPLRFLLEGVRVAGSDLIELEPQFRERNRLMLYAGLTRLLDLTFNDKTGIFRPQAAEKYAMHTLGVQASYQSSEVDRLAADLSRYFAAVEVQPRYVRWEGQCQAWLSRRFGRDRRSAAEWATVDSECVIGFAAKAMRQAAWAPIIKRAQQVLGALAEYPKDFGTSITKKKLGGELDLLLWDPETKEFVVTEVKDGGSASGVYLSPLQVACYLAAWRQFASEHAQEALSGLRQLMVQRKNLGLIAHQCALPETPENLKFRPMVVVRAPNRLSSCWQKFETVRRAVEKVWAESGNEASDGLAELRLCAVEDDTFSDISEDLHTWR